MAALEAILPKSEEEFTTVAYWDRFYALREDRAFEWYVDAARSAEVMCPLVASRVEAAGSNLVVNLGCGTCEFPRAMAEAWGVGAAEVPRLRVLSVDTSRGWALLRDKNTKYFNEEEKLVL